MVRLYDTLRCLFSVLHLFSVVFLVHLTVQGHTGGVQHQGLFFFFKLCRSQTQHVVIWLKTPCTSGPEKGLRWRPRRALRCVCSLAQKVEDDIILTLNHIMIFQEESEVLEKRRWGTASAIFQELMCFVLVFLFLHGFGPC